MTNYLMSPSDRYTFKKEECGHMSKKHLLFGKINGRTDGFLISLSGHKVSKSCYDDLRAGIYRARHAFTRRWREDQPSHCDRAKLPHTWAWAWAFYIFRASLTYVSIGGELCCGMGVKPPTHLYNFV